MQAATFVDQKSSFNSQHDSVEKEINPASLRCIPYDRRTPRDTVFFTDSSPFHTDQVQPTHWSIAWSDLMMTMFILFLSMFVYKTANQEFLSPTTMEVIGGDTSEALDSDQFSRTGQPFAPISPALPLMTGGSVKKAETISLETIDIDTLYPDQPKTEIVSTAPAPAEVTETAEITEEPAAIVEDDQLPPSLAPEINEINAAIVVETPGKPIPVPSPDQDIIEPRPLILEEPSKPEPAQFQEIYRLSKKALTSNNLEKFAAVDLIPDKTMRIILTGDLMFTTGHAKLTKVSLTSLEKLASAIRQTPYMINVVGHTDNVPMYSGRFTSNWELSVARASTVARFLIEEMGMNPTQFVVSGYASYRPIVPNTTSTNRAKNRRVEIIISKRLAPPVPANETNLAMNP